MSKKSKSAREKSDRLDWIFTVIDILLFFPRIIVQFIRWLINIF